MFKDFLIQIILILIYLIVQDPLVLDVIGRCHASLVFEALISASD